MDWLMVVVNKGVGVRLEYATIQLKLRRLTSEESRLRTFLFVVEFSEFVE